MEPDIPQFPWVEAAPLHSGAWAWQHGYVSCKPFAAYYQQADGACSWCNGTHALTLFGCLASCTAIQDWRALVLKGYPAPWLDIINAWWPTAPLSEQKAVLRFRHPPTSLTSQLKLMGSDVAVAMRRRLPAMAAATSAIFRLSRASA